MKNFGYGLWKNVTGRRSAQIISATVLFTVLSCSPEEGIQERPKDIINTTVRAETLTKISEMFPDFQNQRLTRPELFQIDAEKRIVLSEASEVYVTFVSEGAAIDNSFGYYVYQPGSTPSNTSDLKLNLLFPSVSDGVLKQGDMLQLGKGKFPAGTIIGFFLVVGGWEANTVHYDRETFYTDYNLNTLDQQQHILFKLKDFGDVILAFEDIKTVNSSDEDFNDIIFTVSDNKENKEVTNFNISSVIQL